MTTPWPSSPCIGICRVERGYCVGCLRTLSEIAAWSRMREAERLQVMHEVLPERRRALEAKIVQEGGKEKGE